MPFLLIGKYGNHGSGWGGKMKGWEGDGGGGSFDIAQCIFFFFSCYRFCLRERILEDLANLSFHSP